MRVTIPVPSDWWRTVSPVDRSGMSERGARSFQKPALALCSPQGVGADHTHAVGLHRAQALTEALEASQCAFCRGIIQPPAVTQAGGKAHHFPEPVKDYELAVRMTRDDHVKAVGAQVDGGEDVGYDTTAAHLGGQHS